MCFGDFFYVSTPSTFNLPYPALSSFIGSFKNFESATGDIRYQPSEDEKDAELIERSWLITTSPGTKIILDFPQFYLRSDSKCVSNSLKIYDSDEPTENTLTGVNCNRRPQQIRSKSNTLLIVYRGTGAGLRSTMFQLRWFTQKSIKGTIFVKSR